MTPLVVVALACARGDASAQAAAVEKALIAAEPKLHRCWEVAAASDYKVEGQIDLIVTIGPHGTAAKVVVKADGVGQKPLADCVVKAFADVPFGDAFATGDAVEVPVTFKAESNVTVRAADVRAVALAGQAGVVKVLVDARSTGADKAALAWIDLSSGGRLVRPLVGAAYIYVRKGRAKFGNQTAATDDVVVLADGTAPAITAHSRTELVALFVPPGAEKDLRAGSPMPKPTPGEPRVIHEADASKFETLAGKGVARIYVEKEAASVDRMRFEAGAAIPEHSHAGTAEILYVVEGKGELTVDGDKYPVEPATAIYIPPGAKHAFVAQQAVDAIQFYTPSGPEQRFKGTSK